MKGTICGEQLGDFVLARKLYAYGEEDSYFDFATCIERVRRGRRERKGVCAVVLSNAGPGEKRTFVDELHNGETWRDAVWSIQEELLIVVGMEWSEISYC